MTNVVTVNGKQCDLSSAFPIRLGVYKKLMRQGIDPSKSDLTQLESMSFMECIISSVNSEITETDFDMLTPKEFGAISNIIKNLSVEQTEDLAPLEDG